MIAGARVVARRWRRILAASASAIAIARVALWVAKAISSASAVDAALNAVGLGEYVRPFEEAIDQVLSVVVQLVAGVT